MLAKILHTHDRRWRLVDLDGHVSQCCDLWSFKAWHAIGFNDFSIGIEIYQDGDGGTYEGQLGVVVKLVDFLTRRFGIIRMIPHQYLGPIPRFINHGGDDVVGVIGHRDCSKQRGIGDPGSAVFRCLGDAGYHGVDYAANSMDRDYVRREIQRPLKIEPPDGICGPGTIARLTELGHPSGMWFTRPGD